MDPLYETAGASHPLNRQAQSWGMTVGLSWPFLDSNPKNLAEMNCYFQISIIFMPFDRWMIGCHLTVPAARLLPGLSSSQI